MLLFSNFCWRCCEHYICHVFAVGTLTTSSGMLSRASVLSMYSFPRTDATLSLLGVKGVLSLKILPISIHAIPSVDCVERSKSNKKYKCSKLFSKYSHSTIALKKSAPCIPFKRQQKLFFMGDFAFYAHRFSSSEQWMLYHIFREEVTLFVTCSC